MDRQGDAWPLPYRSFERYFGIAALAVLNLLILSVAVITLPASAKELSYVSSTPPLEVSFKISGGHYSGTVCGGNLILQTDVPDPPVVRFSKAEKGKLYTLMMLDFDGNADGSWPDKVGPGKNSPVRHWIVGNIPGTLLAGNGYIEPATAKANPEASNSQEITVLQPYRYPHIPVVSDRYAIYLFEQDKHIEFAHLPDPITNFDDVAFIKRYHLGDPVASNWFVAVYTSETPFSGKAFHGNDVSKSWHKDIGQGTLGRE